MRRPRSPYSMRSPEPASTQSSSAFLTAIRWPTDRQSRQRDSARSQAGTTIAAVLELARTHHERGGAPTVLFTYFNPVYQFGIERFAREAAGAGASAVIVPDIALEEGAALGATLAENGLDMPLLVAPSTRPGARETHRCAEHRFHLRGFALGCNLARVRGLRPMRCARRSRCYARLPTSRWPSASV